MTQPDPYDAPRAPLIARAEPSPAAGRSRWMLLRWVPILLCLLVAGLGLVGATRIGWLLLFRRSEWIGGSTFAGPVVMGGVVAIVFLLMVGLAGYLTAGSWYFGRWRAAVVASTGFALLVGFVWSVLLQSF